MLRMGLCMASMMRTRRLHPRAWRELQMAGVPGAHAAAGALVVAPAWLGI
jgi:hypothetical protein